MLTALLQTPQCLWGALRVPSRLCSTADEGPRGIWALLSYEASSLALFPAGHPEPLRGRQPTSSK